MEFRCRPYSRRVSIGVPVRSTIFPSPSRLANSRDLLRRLIAGWVVKVRKSGGRQRAASHSLHPDRV